jgi:two-component system, OmpR family, response regulator
MFRPEVVIVEDDYQMRTMLKYIVQSKFNVVDFESAESFLMYKDKKPFSLYILDNNLQGINGMQLTQFIRAKDKISPILMVSGDHDKETITAGLTSGADDYITKPFDTNFLTIKINNLNERIQSIASNLMNVGFKFIDESRTMIFNGKSTSFTAREYQVLRGLHQTLGHSQSREDLVHLLGDDTTTRNIDVIVCSLRKKIENLSMTIHNIRGIGYSLEIKRS